MMPLLHRVLLPCLAVLPVVADEGEPPVRLRAQSVECSYITPAAEASTPAPLCTVRLHVKASEGVSFVTPAMGVPFASPLVGRDAAGRLMVGVFRGCESCLEQCRTLVYDFYARPQGGWIEFDTSIDLHVSTGYMSTRPCVFNPRRAAALQIAGMSFFCTPLPTTEAEHAQDVLFRLEYEVSPVVHSLEFRDAEGTPCKHRVLGGDYSENDGLTRATYLLSLKGEQAIMVLRLHTPPKPLRVPVRLRAYMGAITDPDIGP